MSERRLYLFLMPLLIFIGYLCSLDYFPDNKPQKRSYIERAVIAFEKMAAAEIKQSNLSPRIEKKEISEKFKQFFEVRKKLLEQLGPMPWVIWKRILWYQEMQRLKEGIETRMNGDSFFVPKWVKKSKEEVFLKSS